jgi:hypothetical protein
MMGLDPIIAVVQCKRGSVLLHCGASGRFIRVSVVGLLR